MKKHVQSEHSELLILPTGQILAHNITQEMAAVLAELDPKNELIQKRMVKSMPSHPAQCPNR